MILCGLIDLPAEQATRRCKGYGTLCRCRALCVVRFGLDLISVRLRLITRRRFLACSAGRSTCDGRNWRHRVHDGKEADGAAQLQGETDDPDCKGERTMGEESLQ